MASLLLPLSCSAFHGHPHSLSQCSLSITLIPSPRHRSPSFLFNALFHSFRLSLFVCLSLIQGRRRSDTEINSRPCDVLVSQRWGQRHWVILSGVSAAPFGNKPLMNLQWSVNHWIPGWQISSSLDLFLTFRNHLPNGCPNHNQQKLFFFWKFSFNFGFTKHFSYTF